MLQSLSRRKIVYLNLMILLRADLQASQLKNNLHLKRLPRKLQLRKKKLQRKVLLIPREFLQVLLPKISQNKKILTYLKFLDLALIIESFVKTFKKCLQAPLLNQKLKKNWLKKKKPLKKRCLLRRSKLQSKSGLQLKIPTKK